MIGGEIENVCFSMVGRARKNCSVEEICYDLVIHHTRYNLLQLSIQSVLSMATCLHQASGCLTYHATKPGHVTFSLHCWRTVTFSSRASVSSYNPKPRRFLRSRKYNWHWHTSAVSFFRHTIIIILLHSRYYPVSVSTEPYVAQSSTGSQKKIVNLFEGYVQCDTFASEYQGSEHILMVNIFENRVLRRIFGVCEGRGNRGIKEDYIIWSFMLWTPHQISFGW